VERNAEVSLSAFDEGSESENPAFRIATRTSFSRRLGLMSTAAGELSGYTNLAEPDLLFAVVRSTNTRFSDW